ncbi:hypothetical protein K432DRAFT_312103 [Lepidopterella palustris CBS 459.81]|uniref:Uncharacterized protein n=1 Tax=Lepidopterella palustris CBS 459.81 TaxID=1314670 RepID=A0A8E2DXX0_9PEZI|nr:hypothetical protein K432DRAFT_312103 [Lepidopterella palustris CBS 459.81]
MEDLGGSITQEQGRGRGRGRKTVAFEEVAKKTSWPLEDLKNCYKRSRNFMYLLESDGPGYLLELGTGVSHIWQRLSHDDINLLRKYRQSKLQDVEERSKKLHIVAARVFIRGLVAYGWTYRQLAQCRSNLMIQLGRYVDLEKLAGGEILALEVQGNKRPCVDSGGESGKRRCRRSSTTELETNRQEDPQAVRLEATSQPGAEGSRIPTSGSAPRTYMNICLTA